MGTLDLLKRGEKGSALTTAEHDANFTAIETEVNGRVETTDARLTNSREWTAATIDQAEAEAGTATTRRAFTAQRVRQAIEAWWAALTLAPSKVTMTTARLLGRTTAGSGAAEEISIGSGLTLSAGTLSASGGALPTGITSPGDGALAAATGTITASRPGYDITQTWNAAGVTFTGWRVNITDTASAAASLLMTLQVGGAEWFSVRKDGRVFARQSAGYSFVGADNTCIIRNIQNGANAVTTTVNGVAELAVEQSGITVRRLAFGTSSGDTITADAYIARDGANTLAQRNGTNAQESRTYGTFTDASNYRRVAIGMSTGGTAYLRPEGAGTGASGNVIHISGLPTSNPGPGILWNDAGTVKVGT